MRVPLPSSVSIPACKASSNRSSMVSSSRLPLLSIERRVWNSKEPPRTAARTSRRWQAVLMRPRRRSRTAAMVSGKGREAPGVRWVGATGSETRDDASTSAEDRRVSMSRASSSAKNGFPGMGLDVTHSRLGQIGDKGANLLIGKRLHRDGLDGLLAVQVVHHRTQGMIGREFDIAAGTDNHDGRVT